MKMVQIQWTCASIDEARKICRFLVQEKIVACANIIPWVESIFLWDGQIDTSQETKVFLKTRSENFDAVKNVILANCSYEVPEITQVAFCDANEHYIQWLEENVNLAKNPLH